MATMIARKNKSGKTYYTVQFQLGLRRPCVPLGPMDKQSANELRGYIQQLAVCRRSNGTISGKTAAWLSGVDEAFYAVLVDRGLCDPREQPEPDPTSKVPTLGAFLRRYVKERSDTKPATRIVYGHTRRCLIGYFGADRPLDSITTAEAGDWRRWLARPTKEKGQGLADNTVRRRCGIAKQFFRDAVDRELIDRNPFAKIKGLTVRANRERDYFVSVDEATKVIKACPDNQWKLLFALSRYGGLRCPSEHLALTWGDVDFEAGRIRIRSPKTEHHEGKGERLMPLFPELRPYLQAVLDELLVDFDPKAKRLSEQPVITRYRDSNANLRTTLCKIIRRAKLTPWAKLFHNLRATRQTELEAKFPLHVVCSWLGNSTRVAQQHYLQVTDDHFAAAIGDSCAANAQQQLAVTGDNSGNRRQDEIENRYTVDISAEREEKGWATLDSNSGARIGDFEESPGCAAYAQQLDPQLAAVVAAWPGLTDQQRASILAIVQGDG